MSHIIFVTLLLRSIVLLPGRSDNTHNCLLNFHSLDIVSRLSIVIGKKVGACDFHMPTSAPYLLVFFCSRHTTCTTPNKTISDASSLDLQRGKSPSILILEKVYLTPSPLEGCLLHPLNFKTGYLTPSTLQNRTNNPPKRFWTVVLLQ